MPSPVTACDYCQKEFRRDAIASHIKSKHAREIGVALLEEYKSFAGKPIECNTSTLKRIMMGMKPQSYGLESELQSGVYWFGVKPRLFCCNGSPLPKDKAEWMLKPDDEDVELIEYLNSEQNLKAHAAFMREVTNTITLTEMIDAGVQMHARSPEYLKIMMRNKDLSTELEGLKKEYKKAVSTAEILHQDVLALRNENGLQCSVANLQEELRSTRVTAGYAQKEVENLRARLKQMEAEHEEEVQQLKESRNATSRELVDQNYELSKKNQNYEETLKKKIREGVEKEMDKLRKEQEKEKAAKKKAEKKAKLAAMLAKLEAGSGSDDSDSE